MTRAVLTSLAVSGDTTLTKVGYVGVIMNSQTSGNPYLGFQVNGADKATVYYDRASDKLAFQTAAVDRLAITAAGDLIAAGTLSVSGDLVIGSSAVVLGDDGTIVATGTLSLGGSLTLSKAGYIGVVMNSLTSGNPYFAFQIDGADKASVHYDRAADRMVFYSAGADRAYLTPTGDFVVGASAVTLTAAGVVTATGLGNFSTAGLRTKHESAATPTGGSSGEVRVGTDKLWANDGGTWKSTALSAAGAPSFASMAKWGTD